MEEVTTASLPEVTNEARPDAMDDDWIANFLAWCRKVSNREMQGLRARLLAGEANVTGTCSKRADDFVAARCAPARTSARVPQSRPPSAQLGLSPALLKTMR